MNNYKLKIGKQNGELVLILLETGEWVQDDDGFVSRIEKSIAFLPIRDKQLERFQLSMMNNQNNSFFEFSLYNPSIDFTYDK